MEFSSQLLKSGRSWHRLSFSPLSSRAVEGSALVSDVLFLVFWISISITSHANHHRIHDSNCNMIPSASQSDSRRFKNRHYVNLSKSTYSLKTIKRLIITGIANKQDTCLTGYKGQMTCLKKMLLPIHCASFPLLLKKAVLSSPTAQQTSYQTWLIAVICTLGSH